MLVSGELMSVIDNIDFESKNELLAKLRAMRASTVSFAPSRRAVIKQIIGICIQEVYFAKEKDLLDYKSFLNKRKKQLKRG